jgi:hypothetical protein
MSLIINKTEQVTFLGNVYTDINAIEITVDDSFKSLMEKFYSVMTKHGICQGVWSENGRTIHTAEWCFCWNVFRGNIDSKLGLMSIMQEPPEHLLAYGPEPIRS